MTVIDEFEELVEEFLNTPHAIAVCNGTAGLHTAVSILGVGKDDVVITTPFSFIASANCILFNGATPVFADIDSKTLCIDPKEIEKRIKDCRLVGKEPKAIIVVHLFGKACDMDAIMKIARKYGIPVIEDCAQAFGVKYKGRYVGTIGDIGVFSFYATKNLWTFEGGMVVTHWNTFAGWARAFIDHGQVNKYEHTILGHNYRMPQICALIGLTQLKLHKTGIIAELGTYGVKTGHYPDVIYNQPLYKRLGIKGNCPIAEKAAKEARIYFRQ